jgi:enamine deaminase RidA (YjgF/YER057c/UK114 family)
VGSEFLGKLYRMTGATGQSTTRGDFCPFRNLSLGAGLKFAAKAALMRSVCRFALLKTNLTHMSVLQRLADLKLELPPPPKPAGVYKPVVQVGNLIYVSGHGPLKSDGTLITGKVGADLTQEEGYLAARQTGLAILASVQLFLGSLDRVKRTIKTLGMVNCPVEFTQHPAVINGYSDLLRELYGDNGVGARSAVGMGSLPGNIAVEIEVIFEIE